jgi:hypothetical protein
MTSPVTADSKRNLNQRLGRNGIESDKICYQPRGKCDLMRQIFALHSSLTQSALALANNNRVNGAFDGSMDFASS